MTKEQVIKIFKEKFNNENPEVSRPRTCKLNWEHTDYNGSFVFPGAIDKGMIAAIRFNGTDKIRAYAIDLDESSEFGLIEEDAPNEGWAKYLLVYAVR